MNRSILFLMFLCINPLTAEEIMSSASTSDIYQINCLSCVPPERDQARMVLRTDSCIGILRTDQHGARGWLGRAVYYVIGHLNPEQALSIAGDRSRCEVMHTIACQRLFNASRGNYAEAGNKNVDENGKPTSDPLYHHPHRHVLPRYKDSVEWRGKKFKDHTFYAPMSLDPTPSKDELVLNEEQKVNIPLTLEEVALLKMDIQKEFVKMIFDEAVPTVFRPRWEEISNAFPAAEVVDFYHSFIKS